MMETWPSMVKARARICKPFSTFSRADTLLLVHVLILFKPNGALQIITNSMDASTTLNLNTTLSVCLWQKTKPFQIPLSFDTGKKKMRLWCLKVGRAEMKLEEGEDDWMMGVGKWCQEKKGAVERLECLEREAIMGQDEGKHPTDYQRRAHIFDKSSRVFQALKERSALNPSP